MAGCQKSSFKEICSKRRWYASNRKTKSQSKRNYWEVWISKIVGWNMHSIRLDLWRTYKRRKTIISEIRRHGKLSMQILPWNRLERESSYGTLQLRWLFKIRTFEMCSNMANKNDKSKNCWQINSDHLETISMLTLP